jgi:hypothetical protein
MADTSSRTPFNVTEKRIGTDPYCPPVLAVPSNNTPFIIESGDELPTENKKRMGDEIMRDTVRVREETAVKNCQVSQEKSVQDVPKFYHRHCQRRVQWCVQALELGQGLYARKSSSMTAGLWKFTILSEVRWSGYRGETLGKRELLCIWRTICRNTPK